MCIDDMSCARSACIETKTEHTKSVIEAREFIIDVRGETALDGKLSGDWKRMVLRNINHAGGKRRTIAIDLKCRSDCQKSWTAQERHVHELWQSITATH